MSQNLSDLTNMDDYTDLVKILRAVIRRMLGAERTIYVKEDNEDPEERILNLHPNYFIDDMGN